MVSEYDLPCTECGHDLTQATVALTDGDTEVQVAKCARCGTRHFPHSTIDSIRSRTRI